MKPVIASTLLIGTALAQYTGQIKVVDDSCPMFVAGEKGKTVQWNAPAGTICADISDICPEGKCFVALQAVGTGVNTGMPDKMAACPGSDCSADCTTWDLNKGSSDFTLDCAEFTGEHYFYLGY
ncbi:high-affinity glucose transporter [Emericellopsis cladophorae]|uniref:High-affinity glucose transporter n=1 Tax=Emericellopsis cladophorae TaxID=2686198 RepID=A0A9P9Y1S9_9HYPO|nr:high-affinity glucose transporter [Emericellopsis cladophorae]KAI6781563.1 high-affinity glucose transporter [Emericellopsis cladophorae]